VISLGRAARLHPPPPEIALPAVIGAGFFVTPNPLWAMLFYLGVLPAWGWNLARRAAWPQDAGSAVGIALILWFTATTAWDAASPSVHGLWLWNGLCTLVFFAAARIAFGAEGGGRDRLVTVLIACALGNAAIAFVHLAIVGPVDGRMTGWRRRGTRSSAPRRWGSACCSPPGGC